MEFGPIDGGAGLTSGASGSGPTATAFTAGTSATAARRRTPGRWRRIPRAIVHKHVTLPEEVRQALPPPLPEEVWRAMPEEARKTREEVVRATQARLKDLRKFEEEKKTLPTFMAEGYDPSPSTGRLYETRADQGDPLRTVPILPIHVMLEGSRECEEAEEESNRNLLEQARLLEEEDEDLCDTEEAKIAFRAFKVKFAAFYRSLATTKPQFIYDPPSDTFEEHLTAEEMERQASISGWPVCSQAQHFATLALEWYNSTKKTPKLEIAKVLLSKCFTDVDYTTYAHVNFTATATATADSATPTSGSATPTSGSHSPKRLFFAEIMLIPSLQAWKDTDMRVLSVSAIDNSCFGGCDEMVRDIKGPLRKDMDYERCHACSDRIKHPRGDQFVAGHNRTRMPYVSMFRFRGHTSHSSSVLSYMQRANEFVAGYNQWRIQNPSTRGG